MPGGLKKNKNQYISLKEVIEILGCSRDYLTYLCRKGKLKARKIGVEWMTTKKWIEEYQKKNQNTNNIQPRVLSNTTKLRISTNIRIKNKKLKRENGIILPLYFGWALQIKVSLIKYHSYIRKIFVIRKWWQEAVALILLVALVGSGFLFFQNVKNILGATYTWFQTDWSGGADTVNFPVHPTNQSGWTKYYSKDSGIATGTELTLTLTSSSTTQTSDTDFLAGTFSNTTTTSSGTAAVVNLQTNPAGNTMTFYPDAHPETTSVDGDVYYMNIDKVTWSTLVTTANDGYSDNSSGVNVASWYCSNELNRYTVIRRGIFLFDTSALPNDAAISAATLSLYGSSKTSGVVGESTLNVNIYSSSPASNIALSVGDTLGSTAFSTAIAHANWSTTGYNNFSLNASGIAAISTTSVSKFGTRSSSNDVANVAPTWSTYAYPSLGAYTAEQGTGYKPKLVVTFTPAYYSSGDFTSSDIDTGQNSDFTTLNFTIDEPANTDLKFQLRTAATSGGLDSATWYGPTGTGDYYTSTGQTINSTHDGDRWVQYKGFFSTTDTSVTPTLSDITINYTYYPASATLTSSPYNANDAASVLSKIQWTKTLPSASTTIKFQVRTAPASGTDPGTWTAWMGPDGTSGTYFTDSSGGEAMPSALSDGVNDQWIQYKVWLETTNSGQTPTLSDVTLTYVVNAPPEFETTPTINVASSTEVQISYSIRDPDTDVGSPANQWKLWPSFEYSLDNGGSWSSISTSTLSGPDPDHPVNLGPATSTWVASTTYWNAKQSTTTYSTTAKIRITINDHEAANNTTVTTTAAFTLDTKDPVGGTPTGGGTGININQNATTTLANDKTATTSVTLYLSATDDSSLQMRLWETGGADTGWIGYASTYAFTLSSGDGTKTIYARFKDSFGNEVGSYSDTIVLDTTAPTAPANFIIQDISNPTISEYRLFVNYAKNTESDWVDYKTYRSTNGTSYTLYSTISDINLNYFTDSSVVSGTTYYYKVVSIDDISNTATSSAVSLTAGSNPTDNVSPTISSVATSTVTASSIKASWTTDEVADSNVFYSTDLSFGSSQGVSGYLTSHSVTLVGLSSGTTYNFYVRSIDPSSNPATSSSAQFTTLTGDTTAPTISNIQVATTTSNSATITWTTDELSSSFVEYSTTTGFSVGTIYGFYDSTTSHSVTLPAVLSTSTTYYFKVRSKDAAGNEGVSTQQSFATSAAPPTDVTPPVISAISSGTPAYNTATITWTTNENSDSYVEFGLSTSYGRIYGQDDSTTTHSVQLPKDLTPASTYHFRVRSRDAAGNEAISGDYTFATAASPNDTTAPTITFDPATGISEPTQTSVTISWTTNEDANSYIDYSASTTNYNLSQGSPLMATSHSVNLVGLTPGTQYYFRIKSTDPSGNATTDNNSGVGYTFSTASGTTPPVISNIQIVDVTYNSVTITLTTDKNSNSFVEYGLDTSYGKTAGKYDSVTSHSVTLTGLLSQATYHFRVRSAGSPEAVSQDYTFTTETAPDITPPVISSVEATSITLTSTTISWTTNENSDSLVYYGTTTDYGFVAGTTATSTTSHIVQLSNLNASTTYHYKVSSKDSSGNITESEDDTFETIADTTAPVISGVAAPVVDRNSATITWDTNELATSKVEYATSSNLTNSTTTTEITDLRLEHSVIISNLLSDTTYYYRAISKDSSNNLATSSISSFTTKNPKEDFTAPTISSVATSSISLTSAKVSWQTNELSNSLVDYGTTISLGILAGNFTDSTTTHSVTITNLTASTTYYFQVRSQDASGNTATDNNSDQYYTFKTLADTTSPTISEVVTAVIRDISAVVTWLTNELSTSQVEYGTSISYGTLTTEDTTLTIQHSVTISGLTKETKYYYKVISKDGTENKSEDDNSGQGYAFTTTKEPGEIVYTGEVIYIGVGGGGGGASDIWPPKISGLKITNITKSSATISWSTDEEGSSLIAYGETEKYGSLTGNHQEKIRVHSVSLTDLKSEITYHFQAVSYDSTGNAGKSSNQTFKTLGIGEKAPPEEIPKEIPEKVVEVPPEIKEMEEKIEAGGGVIELIKKASQAFINKVIEALPQNPYLKELPEAEFIASISEMAPKVVLAPIISGEYPQMEVGADYVRIIWVTNKKSNSLVAYASAEEYDPAKDEPYKIVAGNPDELVTSHLVEITGLKPNTLYHYEVRSKAQLGDWAKSGDRTFVTLSHLPEISETKFLEIAENTVTLSWQTTLPTKTKIETKDTKTGEKLIQEDPSFLKEHKFTVKNLRISTSYSLQIFSQDEEDNTSFSPILPFSTSVSLEPPVISQIRVSTALIPGKIERIQAIISWKTDKPATSRVYYEEGITLREELAFSTPLDPNLVLDHIMISTVFKPGRVYQFRAESIDAFNNASYSRNFTILTPRPRESVVDLIIQNFEQTFEFLKGIKF